VAEQRQVEASLRQATTVKRTRRKHLEKLLTQLAGYVGYASSGKAAVIQAAGMAASDTGSPVGTLPAPENLRAQPGTFDGEVILRWRAMPRVRIFSTSSTANRATGSAPRPSPAVAPACATSPPASATPSASAPSPPPDPAPGPTPPFPAPADVLP